MAGQGRPLLAGGGVIHADLTAGVAGGQEGAVAIYFEAAAVITVLVLLGQVLELRAREKTSGAIKALLDLAPKTAVRVSASGIDETVPIDTIQVGELLRVRPGEKVPVDGELTEGKGTVDESMVTGEPMPAVKAPGSKVTAGTMNQTGGFVMRAEKVGADTLLSQIVHMVAAAQRSRAPIQRMADMVSAWFVPVVIAVALLTFVVWLLWGPSPAFSYALITSVAVLIIACPCALGLATPMSIMVGVGQGALHGLHLLVDGLGTGCCARRGGICCSSAAGWVMCRMILFGLGCLREGNSRDDSCGHCGGSKNSCSHDEFLLEFQLHYPCLSAVAL